GTDHLSILLAGGGLPHGSHHRLPPACRAVPTPAMMRIAANPRQAYHQAEYVVFSTPPFTLRIGEPSEALIRLYARLGCDCCIYLTACNPRSRRLRPKANARRMRALSRVLARQGWRT